MRLAGFRIDELGARGLARHWRRGGFPPAYLARSEVDSYRWRGDFVRTFLERDVPQFGIRIPAPALHRFWSMVAHVHGNIWSAADPARSLGISQPTVRQYLDLLSALFMVRRLPAWHENLAKRQVRSPKVYIRDTGLLHQLLGIRTEPELLRHARLGASWEGYVIEETIKRLQPNDACFWATHGGAELDLFLVKDGRRYGVEVKRQDAPRLTTSMRTAMDALGLEGLSVLYPGSRAYELAEGIRVLPAACLAGGDAESILARRSRRPSRPRGGETS